MIDADRNSKALQEHCDLFSPNDSNYQLLAVKSTELLQEYYKIHNQKKKEYHKILDQLKIDYPYMFHKRSNLPLKRYSLFIDSKLPKLYYLPYNCD